MNKTNGIGGVLPRMNRKGKRGGLCLITTLIAGSGAITLTVLGATALICKVSPLVFDYSACREISTSAIRAAVQIIQANPGIATMIDAGLATTATLTAIAARAPRSGKSKKGGRR